MERFVRSDRQEMAPVGDGAVVLELDSGETWSLNAVGTTVWTLLAEPHSAEELCELVLERYDVERARCATDIAALLGQLEAAGLVSRSTRTPPPGG